MSSDPRLQPQVKIPLEVTEEFTPTRKGGKMQICWMYAGGKFPQQHNIFVRGSGPDREGDPLKPGLYYCTRVKKVDFDFVVDTDTMTPAQGPAK